MSRFDAGAAVPVEKTKGSSSVPRADDATREPVRDTAEASSERRDLVVVNPKLTPDRATPRGNGKPSRYADALFLAHMFASKFDAPQQREKRRADPADANASYRKSARVPGKIGRVLSKKI